MPLISVPISGDYPVLREALVDLVADDRSLELVASARDADEAIRLANANEQRPDLALLDVKMPRCGGPRATHEIRAISPAIRVVALSAYEDRVPVMEMLRAGAVGYLLKGASVGGIQEGFITRSRAGHRWLAKSPGGWSRSFPHSSSEKSARCRSARSASSQRKDEATISGRTSNSWRKHD